MLLAEANVEPAVPAAWRIFEVSLWLVGFLLLAALILQIVRVRRQRSRGLGSTLSQQLTEFRQAYERGEMSKEEYERVHALMTGRIQQTAKPATAATPTTTPEAKPHSDAPSKNGEPGGNGE